MQRIFLILVLLSAIIFPAYALKACAVEEVVTSFFDNLVECEGDTQVSIQSIVYVTETGNDYSKMKPAILSNDIEVKVKTKLCGIQDQYFVWLRKNESSYDVISYTSFSQPE